MSDLRSRPRGSKRLSTIARHGRLKKSNPFATLAKILAATLAVVLVSGVSVAAIAAWDITSSVKPGIHLVGEKTNGPVPSIGAIDGGVNLLLVGTDTRTGQGEGYGDPEDSSEGNGLNDVTILMHISQDHTSATVVSFPRDLMIPIPRCPDGKGGFSTAMSNQQLNTTLTYGGLPCTVETIKSLTGLDIPFAAEISFDGVISMSNAVGGVSVCIAEPIDDDLTGIHLPAGQATLKGSDALEFLRTRHGVGNGSDLSRISNQQVFLSSLVRTIKSGGTLNDPFKLYPLAKAAATHMQLSDSLSNPSTMVQIALALKNIDLSNVLFLQYPVVDDPDDINRVVPNEGDADALFSALAADQHLQLSGTTGSGSVLDPNAPAPVAPAPDAAVTATPAPGATADAAPSASSAPPVILPEGVNGQTAGQYTCSKGNN